MNLRLHSLFGLTAAVLLGTARLAAAPAPAPAEPPRVAALFVYNRAGPDFAGKQAAFQDFLASRITGAGFRIVSRDVALTALSTTAGGGPPVAADKLFDSQSSALRLAQNLGAQYVLVAALDSYGTTPRSFTGYGVNVTTNTATLRVSYRLCDAAQGGAIIGDAFSVDHVLAETASLKEGDTDVVNQLIDQAAAKIAEAFKHAATAENIAAATAAPKNVEFSVVCSTGDIVIPDVTRTPAGDYVVGPLKYTVAPLDVTVTLNGAAVGSAPGTFSGPPGLSTLRLARDGFKPWQQIVSLSPGFKLNVALQMDAAGYARWKDSIEFLQNLKTSAKLSDAEVEKVRGIAQMFRQSGYRFDERTDVKATQLPNVQQVNQSLFATPPLPTTTR